MDILIPGQHVPVLLDCDVPVCGAAVKGND